MFKPKKFKRYLDIRKKGEPFPAQVWHVVILKPQLLGWVAVFSAALGSRPQKDVGRKCSGTAHVTRKLR